MKKLDPKLGKYTVYEIPGYKIGVTDNIDRTMAFESVRFGTQVYDWLSLGTTDDLVSAVEMAFSMHLKRGYRVVGSVINL